MWVILSYAKKSLRRLQQRFANNEILVLGDSHAHVFEHWYWLLKYPRHYFRVCSIQGATASGLDNPNSKTQAYNHFVKALFEFSARRIVLMLGEVDVGFVIWYRAKRYGVPPSLTFQYSVKSYCKFIDMVASHGELLVISCPLPTISDGTGKGEVANLRREVNIRQVDRTEMTVRFNRAVEKHCLNRNIKNINLDRDSIGADGLVLSELLSSHRLDHHYHKRTYAQLIAKHIPPFIM